VRRASESKGQSGKLAKKAKLNGVEKERFYGPPAPSKKKNEDMEELVDVHLETEEDRDAEDDDDDADDDDEDADDDADDDDADDDDADDDDADDDDDDDDEDSVDKA